MTGLHPEDFGILLRYTTTEKDKPRVERGEWAN